MKALISRPFRSWRGNRAERAVIPRVGTPEYDAHVEGELRHYSSLFDDMDARETLVEPSCSAWDETLRRVDTVVEERIGVGQFGYVEARLGAAPKSSLLSLGSGPGGVELGFARAAPDASITCLDLNPDLLALGQAEADRSALRVTFEQADLNAVELPAAAYDIVFCHASLHHLIELEHVARQIDRTLRDDGELVVIDLATRNGYLMWAETREAARRIFKALPDRLRFNHTAYGEVRLDAEIWEEVTSDASMECVRSEDIVPVLRATFDERVHVRHLSLARRFLNTMYGPNYDLEHSLDRAAMEWIWQLDRHYLATGELRGESFFGVFGRRR